MLKIKLDLTINGANGVCSATGPLQIEGGKYNGAELIAAGAAIGCVIGKFIPLMQDDEDLMYEFVNMVCKPFEEAAKGANKKGGQGYAEKQ